MFWKVIFLGKEQANLRQFLSKKFIFMFLLKCLSQFMIIGMYSLLPAPQDENSLSPGWERLAQKK
jgi:hypothetical protein